MTVQSNIETNLQRLAHLQTRVETLEDEVMKPDTTIDLVTAELMRHKS